MNWTIEAITELLKEKPILRKVVELIESFPQERQTEIIGIVVDFLEVKASENTKH